MSAQLAAIIRESAGDLAQCWASQITTYLGVDLSPYPSPEDPRLLTGLASYLDPDASQPAALLQLSRRAREWGRLAEFRGIEEEQIRDAYLHRQHAEAHGGGPHRDRGRNVGDVQVIGSEQQGPAEA